MSGPLSELQALYLDLHRERIGFLRTRRIEEAIRIASGEVASVEYYSSFCDEPERVRDTQSLREFAGRVMV